MATTSIRRLAEFGQSIWYDYISRSLIESGKLEKLVNDGLRGMTSNPTIFDKAISSGDQYDDEIKRLSSEGKSTFEIYDDLTIRDVQAAADLFKGVYKETARLDGYVSLELNPTLAMKVDESIEEGKRLYSKLNRPNIMLKVPATEAGFRVIEELLADGININATLIFSVEQYTKTAEAFLRGIERLSEKESDLSKIASVASVFVSRVDTTIDEMLEEEQPSLKGKAAVGNIALICQRYQEIFSSDRFNQLKSKGLRPQRALWASTSTKNPEYSDTKYVTELIAKGTVNTLPENTYEAFLDHGVVKEALTSNIENAKGIIEKLRDKGIDINVVCQRLLDKGVEAFIGSFNSLLAAIEEKAKSLCSSI